MLINKSLASVIASIIKKEIIPTKIYRSQLATSEKFTIDIETTDPNQNISVLYKKENDRDKDYCAFDDLAFDYLSFNPRITDILAPPM